ncbi:hypothetical protein WR25_20966 [Diploscapter pachys]|uniref:Cation efflux protein transmembrane domain-containing protein n=1 Tax=Diploscapter pachys TaxID=2018661 RepID=A0A2A2JWY6_9BILA|nr:hypothetical protein WR25_20966 [Diploscapter pachys]
MSGLGWLFAAANHPQGRSGLFAAAACLCCVAVLAFCVSSSHSIVLMSALWITVFAFCSILSSLISMSLSQKPTQKFSYGLARVPVLAVFSTTVLAQLFSVFLSKESFEHLLSPGHHGAHDAAAAHEHDIEQIGSWPYYVGAVACSIALLISAYSLKNQPFQYVLSSASNSSLQAHAADISEAICWVVPGLSRLLLPKINSMVLLAMTTSFLLVLCEHFRHAFSWADPVCCLFLSVAVFSTMWPLSVYTGMILLQTVPQHEINAIDRHVSEASTIEGVLELKVLKLWKLDFLKVVGTVDVRVRRDADEQAVLTRVTEKMSNFIHVLTVQIVKDATWQQAHEFSTSNGGVASSRQPAVTAHGHSHETRDCSSGEGHGHSHDAHSDHGHSHSTSYGSSPYQYSAPSYAPPTQPPAYQYNQTAQTYQTPYQQAQTYQQQMSHYNYGQQVQEHHSHSHDHGHSHEHSNEHGHSHDHSAHGHSHDGVTYH